MEMDTGLSWLRIGTSGGFLWTRLWTFEFHNLWGTLWLSEELSLCRSVVLSYVN